MNNMTDSLFFELGLIFNLFFLFLFRFGFLHKYWRKVGWGGGGGWGLIAVFLDNEVKGGLLMTAPFFLSLSLPSEIIKREREKKSNTANFKASKIEMVKVI
jgi:hypothetical protein